MQRPARIRVRLWDTSAPGAVTLALPGRNMRPAAIAFGIFFVIFAAVEWSAVAGLFRHSVDDVFDLSLLLFQAFWALGWLVGVLILGALTILLAFYSESARIEDGRLIHIPKFGPLQILVDYDLAKVRNARLDGVGGTDSDIVQVRFDYDGGVNALGNAMGRAEGRRVVDAIHHAVLVQEDSRGDLVRLFIHKTGRADDLADAVDRSSAAVFHAGYYAEIDDGVVVPEGGMPL